MNNYKQVCSKCGSDDVYRLKWQNVNTEEVDSNIESGINNEYCNNCGNCYENLIVYESDYKRKDIKV